MLAHGFYEAGSKALGLGLLGWTLLRVTGALLRGACNLMRMGVRALVTICALQAAPAVSKPVRWGTQKFVAWQQSLAICAPSRSLAKTAAHKAEVRQVNGRTAAH